MGKSRRQQSSPYYDEEAGMCVLPEPMCVQPAGNDAAQERLRAARREGPPQGRKWNERAARGVKGVAFGREQGHAALEALLDSKRVRQAIGEGLPEEASRALGVAGTGLGAILGFAGHALGDEQVADSSTGHLANAAAKTTGDVLVGEAFGGLVPEGANALTRGVVQAAGIAAAADDFVRVDNPAKLATATAAELVPGSQAGKAIGGGVDAATVLGQLAVGDQLAAYRGAEVVQENAVNGSYGAVAQAGTLWTAAATGDRETLDKATDRKAKTGERGFFLAWGNAAADMWDEASGSGGSQRGGTYVNGEEYARKLREMRWYKPWTWF